MYQTENQMKRAKDMLLEQQIIETGQLEYISPHIPDKYEERIKQYEEWTGLA